MAARTAKPKSPTKAKTKAKAKVQPKTKAKAKVQPKTKAKAKAKAQPKTKAKTKIAPKAKAAPKAQPSPARSQAKAKAPVAPKTGIARMAKQAAAMKKVIAAVIAPAESGSVIVDAYMRDIDHPFKAEMEAVRAIILGASPKIAERIKWNAPSFFYKDDLGAFHPRASEFAHLILLFPGGAGLPAKSKLLEGTQKDRREAKFYSLSDVESKKRALEKVVKDWVKLRDA